MSRLSQNSTFRSARSSSGSVARNSEDFERTAYLSCSGGSPPGEGGVFNDSGNTSGGSNVTVVPGGSSMNFNLEVSGEALDALEESLKQQLEQLQGEEKQFNEMFERVSNQNEQILTKVQQKTEALKEGTEIVNGEIKELIAERDQTMMDMRNAEQAFSDVHRKYERSMANLKGLKTNEEVMLERDQDLQLAICGRDEKLKIFKEEAAQQTEKVYQEDLMKVAALDLEIQKFSAVRRRAEMRVETLASELEHKQNENKELNTLADELIDKSSKRM